MAFYESGQIGQVGTKGHTKEKHPCTATSLLLQKDLIFAFSHMNVERPCFTVSRTASKIFYSTQIQEQHDTWQSEIGHEIISAAKVVN